jgi:hypothetical protein
MAVHLRGGEAVMAQQPLQSQKGDAFVHSGDRKGMLPHMRRHQLTHTSTVSYPFEHPLVCTGCRANSVMDRKMMFDEWLDRF